MQGVAVAPGNTNFNREDWVQATDSSILYPVYPWEGKCIEGASIAKRGDKLYMFYAGAYNNAPNKSEWRKVKTALSGNAFRKNLSLGTANQANGIPANPVILIFLPIRTDEPTCSIREITITEKPGILHKKRWFGKWKTFSER